MATAFQSDAFQSNAFQIDAAAAPEIAVFGNSVNIVDGDATPSLTDHTDFGSTVEGTPVDRVFTVQNLGTADLTISSVVPPSGYSVFEALSATIAASGSDTFTLRLNASVAGTYSGDLIINSNDSDEAAFNFAVTGIVTAAPPPPPPSGSAGAGQFIGKYFDPSIHGLLHAQRRARNSIR